MWKANADRLRLNEAISKTFVTKEDAEKYARDTEAKIDKGFLVSYEEAQKTKFGELLERYRLEITFKKKSNETEDYKIKYLRTLPIADTLLISVTPTKVAKLRDSLLADRKPATVNKYLAFISFRIYMILEFEIWKIFFFYHRNRKLLKF